VIRSVTLDREEIDVARYPFSIPAIRSLTTLELHPQVTLLAGENGSGKSTLVEGIAVAAGFNPEGGSRNMQHVTRPSHSELHERLRIVRDARPTCDGWFLRAESYYNIATYIEHLEVSGYGDVKLHVAYPGARIYVLDEHGIAETPWDETEVVDLTRSFLADRGRFLHYLFA
jgi:predicted ATPase